MQRPRYRAVKPHRPFRRRPGSLPGRRFALIAASLTLTFGAASAPVRADQDSDQAVTAIVYGAGTTTPVQDTTTIGQLQSGCPTYTGPEIQFYEPGGTLGPPQSLNYSETWSLAAVLSCLPRPIPLASVTGLTVVGSGGPELSGPPENSQLSPSDLASPSDFADPAASPLISSQGSGIVYDRPWRGGGDSNAKDQVFDATPTPFEFEVFQGPLLTVSASASPASAPAGTTITFTAVVTGVPVGAALSYTWNFDGAAADSAQPSPTVVLDTPGTYSVTVQVTDDAGGGGGATIPVTVTGPSTPTTTQTTPTRTGPTTSGGHQPRHPAGRSKTRASGHAHRHHGANATSGSAVPGAGSTRQPATSSGSTNAGSRSNAGTPPSTDTPTSRVQSHARLRAPDTPRRTGFLVAGRLVSDVIAIPERRSPLVRELAAPLATAPAAVAAASPSVLAAFGALAIVVALLGLGAGSEWRRSRGDRRSAKRTEGSS